MVSKNVFSHIIVNVLNNNILSVISQVGIGESSVYITLPIPM